MCSRCPSFLMTRSGDRDGEILIVYGRLTQSQSPITYNQEDNDDWLLPYQHHLKRAFPPQKTHYSPEIDHFLCTISLHINWLSWSDPIRDPIPRPPHPAGYLGPTPSRRPHPAIKIRIRLFIPSRKFTL
jgi:hypothetical protein